ncbi:type II secretion system F family protein [Aeromicrobium panaciterrae]|uniref:type II secretion system F family protein n=1 Tax=Aeromicrobium panaciterrae TaxID=363861 RepID=UPI0031D06AB7
MTILLIGASAIGLAIALAVYLVTARVPASPATSTAPAPAPTKSSLGPQEIPPLYERFASIARRLTPADYTRRLQRRLDIAGNPAGWLPERVLALKGIGLTAGILLGFYLGLQYGPLSTLFFPVVGAAAGFYLPDIWIRNLGERRQVEMRSDLPDAIDMLTVCVEAGLGFDAALGRVAQTMDGPAATEFARVIQEMQFGSSRVDALRAAADRTDIPELRTFISSIVQSTELGISIGDVLRAQSGQMRVVRRQRAEEQAQRLPVKILLPLIFCILPALFVVVLGPAVLNIMDLFSGF